MARHLQTASDLKTYIFRKLGSQLHTVEVTDEQWDDILDASQNYFYDYSDWGNYKQYTIIEPNGQNEIILSDNVLAISECYGMDDAPNVSNMAYPSSSMYYMLAANGGGDQMQMSAFVVMRQYLNTFKDLFREPILYDFNTESKTLRLGRTDYGKIAFRFALSEDIDLVVNNFLFKMIVEKNTLEQWADNLTLKYNTSNTSIMGNGLTLNTDKMYEKANKMEDRINQGIQDDEWGTLIPMKRLYP